MVVPLVMTIIGPDRTGLVEHVARLILEHGGNWMESRMCRLGGEFAGILRIELPEDHKASLVASLKLIPDLQVLAKSDQPKDLQKGIRFIRLEVMGADHPGIVRDIARALAHAQVNVEELTSEVASAPMSGENLFKASARLQIPSSCDLHILQTGLEKIAADLLVDISLSPIPN